MTINITLDDVYNQNLIKSSLSKRILTKLIRDNCQKTAFTFNNKIYEQDVLSMGAYQRQVLANIIIMECEKVIINDLVNDGTIKFYVPFVDDTLSLVRCQYIGNVIKAFNRFDKSLRFITVDKVENETPHFLDLEMSPNGLTISRKNTHTRQYITIYSFTL